MDKEAKKMLLDSVKITRLSGQKTGGQSCGITSTGVKLESELGITITVNNYRSQFKNQALAISLMELAIDEICK